LAYGTESHTGFLQYSATLSFDSGVSFFVTVDPYSADGSSLTEQTYDDAFQAFVSELASIVGASVTEASKNGNFAATVTP
jgi:hypothetical protein